jgi:hypothetical protein
MLATRWSATGDGAGHSTRASLLQRGHDSALSSRRCLLHRPVRAPSDAPCTGWADRSANPRARPIHAQADLSLPIAIAAERDVTWDLGGTHLASYRVVSGVVVHW